MTYEILVNGSSIMNGSIVYAAVVAVVIALLAIILIWHIWKRLRENDVLKYEFITIIAHKFRTPLTSIKWLVESMLPQAHDPGARENMTDIKRSTDKLISMTGTLIELTDTDNESRASYAFEKISLCELVKNVANSVRDRFHEKNLIFGVQCPPDDIFVNIDRVRLEFAVQTLLENACVYTPTGRRVDVIVDRSGRKATVTVADNGIGIDPKDIGHLFSKFYRTANARAADTEGFGVGLYLAQSVIRRHRGKIEAYSPGIDQGSVFTITLPASRK